MSIKIIDDFIEFKNLQIKYTPFEIIDLGYGHLFLKKENSVALEFIINSYIYNKTNKGGSYFLQIDGKRYNFDLEPIFENSIFK